MSTTSNGNQIRQNYHEDSEKGINEQINLELCASYFYAAIAFHFDRDDVALHNISKYFEDQSLEEREHAVKLMKYQNERGGTISLKDIKAPSKMQWGSALEAMEDALELEKSVNESLIKLTKIASEHDDAQLSDFLEGQYLTEQVKDIKEIGDYITTLKRVGPGLGEYFFDQTLKNSK